MIYGFICNLLLETLYRCVTGTNQVTNAFNEMVVFPLDVNSKSDIEIDGREEEVILLLQTSTASLSLSVM